MPGQRIIDVPALAAGVLRGNTRALGRAISLVETARPERDELLFRLATENRATGSDPDLVIPRVIGITGPPGAGKSTLTDGIITNERSDGRRVAVLAVDPSSPFSGGALLGDRVRMDRHSLDEGVFIRSMATRGHFGGLSAASYDTVTVLSAAGFETIIVESVGVGQSETGILSLADITLVVLNPGTGDDIQALKAGVMEIADIFVLNKADLPGIRELERAVRNAISPDESGAATRVQSALVALTSARDGTGIEELSAAIEARLITLERSGELAERRRRRLSSAAEDAAISIVREWIRGRAGSAPEMLSQLRAQLNALLDTKEDI